MINSYNMMVKQDQRQESIFKDSTMLAKVFLLV